MGKSLEFLDLDFFDPNDAIIAITYSSVDFRDLGSNRGSYSKTIKMPSTKVNDVFFGMSFEVQSEGLFDPLIKVPIQITEIEFYGVLQLQSVQTLAGKPITYTVNILGDLSDWASLIGEGSIKDLKHHTSHVLNEETISESWNNTGLTGDYVYPMISYGNFLQDVDSDFNIEVAFWRPAFFTLPLIRQTFKEIGYTFIDSGIKKTPLVNEILPFTSKDVELEAIAVEANNTTANTYELGGVLTSTVSASHSLQFNNEVSDVLNSFNNSIGRYVVPSTGDIEVEVNFVATLRMTSVLIGGAILATPIVNMRVEAVNISTGNSVVITDSVTATGSNTFFFSLSGKATFPQLENDIIDIKLIVEYIAGLKVITSIDIGDMDVKIVPRTSVLATGSVIGHSGALQNIKKIDLIRDVLRKGNFRIVTNVKNKTVEFVQEADFLLTQAEDWSSKVDESKPAEIALIQNQGAKELEWSYVNDSSDSFIADKEGKIDTEWGRKRISLESEYRKGSQTVYTSVFSSTIDHRGIGSLFMPVMSTQEPEQDEPVVGGVFETNFDNRVLIYHGLRNGNFVIDGKPKTQYPYSYFTTHEFSLRWDSEGDEAGKTQIILSNGLDVVFFGNGLIDRYYQNSIKRLNKSKMYTGYFWLTDLDISNLNFRKAKIINGVHYYLNNVIDYELNTNQPTMVELISR